MKKTLFICKAAVLLSIGYCPLTNQANAQNLYGLTSSDGANFGGTIIEYNYTTGVITDKYDLPANSNAQGSLLRAGDGNLYGLTSAGGTNSSGTLFQYNYTANTYSVMQNLPVHANPYGSLLQAADGNLYGLTYRDGTHNSGTLFQYNYTTNTYTVMQNLPVNAYPFASLLQAADGNLYGLTHGAGTYNGGTLFQYNYTTNTYTIMQNLPANANPAGSLLQAADGNLYGLTNGDGTYGGTLFQYNYTTNTYTVMQNLPASANPTGSLLQAADGNLYGLTNGDGTNSSGTLFRYNYTTNTYSVMQNLPVNANPAGSLLQAADGNLYGLTYNDGTSNSGTLFQYNYTANTYTAEVSLSATTGDQPLYTALIEVPSPPPAAALNFDGASTFVSVPDNAGLDISGTITLEAWVYATNGSGTQDVICKSSCTTSNTGYIFPRTDDGWNNFVAYFYIGGGWQTLSAPYAGLNQWHHLAATYDGSYIRLYQDGVLAATSSLIVGSIATNSNPLSIGTQPGCGEFFDGSLDELRVWNVARTQCQINNSMNCELASSDRIGLALYYKFNEGDSASNNTAISTAIDSSGNGNNGTLTNFALTGTTSNWVAPGGVISGVSCGPIVYPTVTVNSATVCAGGTATLTASGATTYTWSTSATTASITATPTVTTNYTVTGADANNCMVSVIDTVTVNALPIVSVNSATVCAGNTATLTVSSPTAVSYTWSTGDNTTSITPSPTVTSNYTVSVTDANNCMNWAMDTVTVNNLPTVTVNSATICAGNSTTLTASGATSYTWSTSATTASITATPTLTAQYTVTGTGANGCVNTATTSVDVNALPTVMALNIDTFVCLGAGDTSTFHAIGANTYTWSTGATTASFTFAPTVAGITTYTVTGTNVNGCKNMATVTQTVSTCGAGIEKYSANNNEITVYPNPNNGSFVVTTTENTSAIMVTDILGNELLSVTPNGTTTNINLNAQPSGVYFIRVMANGVQTVKRIIINN
jgi:uncharacterized repeat protein (TIGR03803 family)